MMIIPFFINLMMIKPDFGEIALGFIVPTIPKESNEALIGLVGAII